MTAKGRVWMLLAAVLATGAGAGIGGVANVMKPADGIVPDGVVMADMNWSKMPAEQARKDLAAWATTKMAEPIALTITAPRGTVRKWSPPRRKLGASVDINSSVQKALAVDGRQTFAARLASLFTHRSTVRLVPTWVLDKTVAARYLKRNVAGSVHRTPHNSRLALTHPGFRIVPGWSGQVLDVEGSLKTIENAVGQEESPTVKLQVVSVNPHVSPADLSTITGELASFTTDFADGGNRGHNVHVAAEHINNTILKPGEEFWYNKVVGPREHGDGFREAPVIIQGRLVPGMGGGVCQVSSTLYNAALLSDLQIVRREHHAFPVHYLPSGRDATVAYGDKDFAFRNSTKNTIAVLANADSGRLQMRIFGTRVPGRTVSLERTDIHSWGPGEQVVHDSSLAAGHTSVIDSGKSGHRVTVWRRVVDNGVQVKRELISHDYYDSFPRIVAVGTRVVQRPTPKVPVQKPVVAQPIPSIPAD